MVSVFVRSNLFLKTENEIITCTLLHNCSFAERGIFFCYVSYYKAFSFSIISYLNYFVNWI